MRILGTLVAALFLFASGPVFAQDTAGTENPQTGEAGGETGEATGTPDAGKHMKKKKSAKKSAKKKHHKDGGMEMGEGADAGM